MKPSHQTRTQSNQTQIRSTNSLELNPITIYNNFSFDLYSRISMTELTAATKNFSPDLIIGHGSFSLVYQGRLSNGVVVAVKKLNSYDFQGLREFRAEMETLGKLRHRNILPLVGYCESDDNRLLVFKYMERGNLNQWLYDTSSVENEKISYSRFPLSWETRIKIIRGTMGYLPPEYRNGCSVLTMKSDVYSFGVLMLEIATGQLPDSLFVINGEEVRMVDWAIKMVAQNLQIQMVDPNIARNRLIEANVKEYFKIACMCTPDSLRERPVMTEIVHLLNQNLL
ncbi:Receptor-like kinase [Quillaja saponaria]|uniref:Receptor-like kinase n=1 Tax=Quillaja saponaria TaxID=32244 RepID=A0AAD7L0N8_QUISA|nr:Receptor-like kinase [Quillaja saponaria]